MGTKTRQTTFAAKHSLLKYLEVLVLQEDTAIFGEVYPEQMTSSHILRVSGAPVKEQSPSSRQEEQNSHRAKKKNQTAASLDKSLYQMELGTQI